MPISLLPQFFFFSILSTIICFTNFTYAYRQCLDDQKTLLVQLKNELIIDNSSYAYPYSEKKLVQWNQTTGDCCSWEGVECDGAGHVIGLQLDDEAISGGIDEKSSSLFSLVYLKKLNLAWNYFNGIQIPRGIGNLTYLTHLNLSAARFGGHVPVELSLLSRLVSLDLSSNYIEPLNEHLNLTMLLRNLTGLRELYIDYIDISIEGSEWSQVISSSLPHLKILSLCDCSLSGTPHPSLLQLHSLSVLRLDGNYQLTAIPSFFANFSSLTILSLSDCSLQGSFPEMIFQVPTLQELDLSRNELLNGTVPQFPHSRAFRSIVLCRTSLSGPLPDSFNNFSMLSTIDLSHCKFSGPIPHTLGNLTEIVHVNLSNNFFTGSIPPFHVSKKLSHINLSFNSLNGSLSSMHFEGLSNLERINLNYNSLSGNIPESLFGLPLLQRLVLNNNKFNGTFQLQKIRRLRNLMTLDLSYNNLSVDASNTNSSFSTFPPVQWLGLASCNLYYFPELRNQSSFRYLDLSNNWIAGKIPNWIWEIGNGERFYLNLSANLFVDLQKPYKFPSSLWVLDLHSNQLQGEIPLPIPPDIRNITSSLLFFSLANNNLSGSIPASLCNSRSLRALDLSFNDLGGNIPPCLLENMGNLQVLNLRKNNISGDIPDKISVNCGLQTLDLSNNNLGGKIPKSLANCKSLEVLNVGNNNINDSFPCMLSPSLRLLVLRSNRFHGEVRCLKSWPNLQIIDIAFNNFSGYLYLINFSSWSGMMAGGHAQLMRNSLGFGFSNKIDMEYYQYKVALTIKGLELELVKIWGDFVSIDFSRNNFQGTIPDAIGDLSSLYLLNLSHNALTGIIPKAFGKLRQLGSLDLSVNQITGVIPEELAGLNFLSVLNLSHNKLVGVIPNGPQFPTFSADSFEGNARLCGFPLNISCNNSAHDQNDLSPSKLENVGEIEWGYVSAALGYVVGLGIVVWSLLFCQNFREIYSEKIDEVFDKIFDGGDRRRRRIRRALRNQVRRQ